MSVLHQTTLSTRDLHRVFASRAQMAESTFLRKEIARRMASHLDVMRIYPQRMVDVGCGERDDSTLLKDRFQIENAQIYDMAWENLTDASEIVKGPRRPLSQKLTSWLLGREVAQQALRAEFSAMPCESQSVDLLWSNLALHWHPEPEKVIAEWVRILAKDGLLIFSCFGPDTLKEVREAFKAVDDAPHTLPFMDMHDVGDVVMRSGIASPVIEMEKITLTYDNVAKLIHDVRGLGGNVLTDRRKGLMGRAAYQRFIGALEALRGEDGRIPLSFEVIYAHGFKAEKSGQTAPVQFFK